MNVSILSIGNELLNGFTLNSNSLWVGKTLTNLGCSISMQITVKDEEKDIIYGLDTLLKSKPKFIIITGGLGPTDDDITRQVIFKYVGTDTKFDRVYWETLSERYLENGITISESNKNQAIVPTTGSIIPNPIGSARGYMFSIQNTKLILLPGVPMEMESMMKNTVVPFIKKSINKFLLIKTFRTTGFPETIIMEKVKRILTSNHNSNIGYYPSLYGVDVRISSYSRKNLGELSEKVSTALGDKIYSEGEKNIEEIIVQQLIEKKKTISIAESCTGGLISHRVTEVPNSSKVLKGGQIVYSDDAKINNLGVDKKIIHSFGAVSSQTAASMANRIKSLYLTDYGLSATGIAGPGGGSKKKAVGLVYIGLAFGDQTKVKKLKLGSERSKNKIRTSQHALNYLRTAIPT